jgi:hypothetical protein
MSRIKITRTHADGSLIHITVSNDRGYFSVTADWPSQQAGGCLHDEVLSVAPELAPLVDLHLSDDITGEPMHAEANGYYWAAGALGGLSQQFHGSNGLTAKSQEECEHIFAEYVRLPLLGARGVLVALQHKAETEGHKQARAWFGQWISTQRSRWAAEAAAGRALLATLISRGGQP